MTDNAEELANVKSCHASGGIGRGEVLLREMVASSGVAMMTSSYQISLLRKGTHAVEQMITHELVA